MRVVNLNSAKTINFLFDLIVREARDLLSDIIQHILITIIIRLSPVFMKIVSPRIRHNAIIRKPSLADYFPFFIGWFFHGGKFKCLLKNRQVLFCRFFPIQDFSRININLKNNIIAPVLLWEEIRDISLVFLNSLAIMKRGGKHVGTLCAKFDFCHARIVAFLME
jgi:hypothetical protein